jgi:hypothetical protein
MVYSGLFGMRFEEGGMRLQPTVPASLGLHSIALRGLQYRQAELTITITGTGSKILRCTIDGVRQQNAFVPSTLTGKHDVKITLAETPSAQNRAAIVRPSPQTHSKLN